jgi:hypothetical protein
VPNPITIRRARVAGAVLITMTCGALAVVPAQWASAHDPIFFSDEQTTPESGPFLPDGTISFALYGALRAPGETRGFQVEFDEGDELYLSLLVPNLLPENALPGEQLPMLTVTAPDGTTTDYTATGAEIFDEPFSRTSYVELLESTEPAQAGVYDMVVTAPIALRFSVAVGTTEEFGTRADRVVDRPATVMAAAGPLQAWYTTTATGEPVPDSDDVAIDGEAVAQAADELAAATTAPATSSATTPPTTALSAPPTTASTATTPAPSAPTDEADTAVAAEAPTASPELVAAGVDDDDGGSSNTALIAILAVVALALGGGAWLARRRRSAADTPSP